MTTPFNKLIQEVETNPWIEYKRKIIEEQSEEEFKQQYLNSWEPTEEFIPVDEMKRNKQFKIHMNFVDIKF